MQHRLRSLIPLLVFAALACAKPNPDEVAPTGAPVHVEVDNRNGQPVEISVTGSGANQRLGVVHPGMKAHFIVPSNLLANGSIEFFAAPGAPGTRSPVYRSGSLLVAPGRVIDMLIAAVLFNSKTSIRP